MALDFDYVLACVAVGVFERKDDYLVDFRITVGYPAVVDFSRCQFFGENLLDNRKTLVA